MKFKSLLLTFLLFAFGQGLMAQDTILTEGFEDGYEDFWKKIVYVPESEEPGVDFGIESDENVFVPEGHQCFYIFGGNEVDTYFISPMLVGTENGLKVSFYYTNYYEETPSYFKVGYSTFSDDVSSFVWEDKTIYANVVDEWLHYENEFPAGTKYVAIKYFWEENNSVFLDDFSFETVSCAMPTKPMLVAVDESSVSVNWTGSNTRYNLKYSKCDYYDFEGGVQDWSSFDSNGKPGCWKRDTEESHGGEYGMHSAFGDEDETDHYLVSPEIVLGGSISFYARYESSLKGSHSSDATADGQFQVLVTTDDNPTSGSHYEVLVTETALPDVWVQVTVPLEDYSGTGHVVIKHLYWDDDWAENLSLYIDDVLILGASSQISNLPGNTEIYELTSLDEETSYAIELQGICEDPETSKVFETSWTEPLYVKTLPSEAPSAYEFVNDGEWSQPNNWSNWYMPQSVDDDVTISANAVIPAGCVAKGNINIGKNVGSITIQDGGQLQHNNAGVVATVKKNITGYGEGDGNWYFIGTGLANEIVNNDIPATGLVSGDDYDFYAWNRTQEEEWRNYRQGGVYGLYPHFGYLYANKANTTINFTGTLLASNEPVIINLDNNTEYEFGNWSLYANPFMCEAAITTSNNENVAYYRMNNAGTGYEASTANINPLEGIFVKASADSQSITFSRASQQTGNNPSQLQVSVSATTRSASVVDNAIIRFDGGNTLEKFMFKENSTKLYIPQGGKDYAVVRSAAQGEMPVNFKANKNGNYTISVNAENTEMNYLHLIDNLTGADVDLLQEPEYTFESTVSDYPSRFRLVFVAKDTEGNVENSESFAFNSNGNFIIVNEGLATLQVIDVQGRMISSETIEGCVSKNLQAAPGVYVLRLINGNNVKVQKIVVR